MPKNDAEDCTFCCSRIGGSTPPRAGIILLQLLQQRAEIKRHVLSHLLASPGGFQTKHKSGTTRVTAGVKLWCWVPVHFTSVESYNAIMPGWLPSSCPVSISEPVQARLWLKGSHAVTPGHTPVTLDRCHQPGHCWQPVTGRQRWSADIVTAFLANVWLWLTSWQGATSNMSSASESRFSLSSSNYQVKSVFSPYLYIMNNSK